MEELNAVLQEDMNLGNESDCYENIEQYFNEAPNIVKPLMNEARITLEKIKKMLYSAPGFINAVRSAVPDFAFRAILTEEQKRQLASGALELMTKKDGSILAKLRDPKTKEIVSNISLEKIKLTPELSQAMTSYATQMQLAQIGEQIQEIQAAVEEVRQGQEYDRLAMAYSCQQKLLQALKIKNKDLKLMALLKIVSDAEDSRNSLMQSQNVNVAFIKNQPESYWGKLMSGDTPKKINSRMNEIRESFCAVNMVSFVEVLAYQEMGEMEAAQLSLQYYGDYIKNTYLSEQGLVERLDMIDPSPENYWSKKLPNIEKHIKALPCYKQAKLVGGKFDGREKM